MTGRIIYAVLGAGTLAGWIAMAHYGTTFGAASYTLPPSVRHSPGGYRSFHFWHSGYHLGK